MSPLAMSPLIRYLETMETDLGQHSDPRQRTLRSRNDPRTSLALLPGDLLSQFPFLPSPPPSRVAPGLLPLSPSLHPHLDSTREPQAFCECLYLPLPWVLQFRAVLLTGMAGTEKLRDLVSLQCTRLLSLRPPFLVFPAAPVRAGALVQSWAGCPQAQAGDCRPPLSTPSPGHAPPCQGEVLLGSQRPGHKLECSSHS